MSFYYEATNDFYQSASEVEILLELAKESDTNRYLFLKLAIVSLVTKFQVFVESILEEFRYGLNNQHSSALSTYILMNSLRLSLTDDNALVGLMKHNNYTEKKRERIIDYLASISYFSDRNQLIDDHFLFNTKYPLGKTGKNELISLLKQIDGNSNPFSGFGEDRIDKLDSLLQTRHLIIHRDRFSGTEETLADSIVFVKELVAYIDGYLKDRLIEIENNETTTQSS